MGEGRSEVAISGASGLIGAALAASLEQSGHRVRRLVRDDSPGGPEDIFWDWPRGRIEADKLAGVDAVVHLAGRNLAAGRWTEKEKALLRDSRVQGTRLIAETLARIDGGPRLLVSASAIGYYGDRGDEMLDEQSAPGSGFLSELCLDWEEAALPVVSAGLRLARLRTGVVIAAAGGMLPKMLPPFRLGLGGKLGDGRQYVSWIAIEDLVGLIRRVLEDETLEGPINAVAPSPVTNRELTRALGATLGRPTVFTVPAAAISLVWGEMGRATMLSSTRVLPARMQQAGFRYLYPDIGSALRRELGR